jgi:serine/threonine protein kinase
MDEENFTEAAIQRLNPQKIWALRNFTTRTATYGITFKAIDLNLRIPVALKVLNLQLFQEDWARRRFFREARSAAVHHPASPVYYLAPRESEIPLAMEFVDGETLEGLSNAPARRAEAGPGNDQVAAGLAAVHQQNLVHREIKPAALWFA